MTDMAKIQVVFFSRYGHIYGSEQWQMTVGEIIGGFPLRRVDDSRR
jgi:hypothetical protein